MLICLLILGLISLMSVQSGPLDKKSWTYEIKSIECTSSNPELLSFNIKNERISRGVYALSGEFVVNLDIMEGDDNQVGAKSFRSANGDGDYKNLPFQLAPSHWGNVLNTHYKDTIMQSLKDCSDLPYFEDKFELPLEKKTYELKECQFSQDGFPNHLQEGYYKLDIFGTGAVEWQIELIVVVESNV